VAGYFMGGYGSYRLATLYPDLFGRAYTIAGPPAAEQWAPPATFSGSWAAHTNVWLENARNVPFLNAVAALDQLVPITGTRAQNSGAPELGIRGFEQLGYRYRFTVYPTMEHLSFGFLSYDLPYAATFLGDSVVDRDPPHVTFSYVPAADDRGLGLIHDHAYWVSEVRLADANAGGPTPKGTVDAFSHSSGKADPPSMPGSSAGVAPLPYVEVNRSWGEPMPIPVENK
jgi:pimeloyl-ACP methyl ester carboxylesterase